MRRILLICNYRKGVGGISGQVEILQRHLREDGFTADIFSTRGNIAKRFILLPVRLLLTTRHYDVLHIHCCSSWGFLPAVLGICSGRLLKKRIMITYHGGDADSFFSSHPGFIKRWLGRSDINIALSDFVGDVFKKYGIPYFIIPNIIDFDDRQHLERTVLRPVFICVRSHEPIYNIMCILRAFQTVQLQLPDASLILLGDGSQHEELIKVSSEMALENVSFPGRVDNTQIYEFLNKADIFLSAPVIDNMPVSVLEAMNAGLLVISSNVGGVPHIVENNISGLLFNSDDDKQLADLMIWTLSHQKESIQMIQNARREVSKYRWENTGSKLKEAYEND